MRKNSIWLLALLITLSGCGGSGGDGKTESGELKGDITISGAFALYPLVVKWAEEFKKVHPKVKIDIQAGGAGKGMTDVLTGNVDLAMVSREVDDAEKGKGAYVVSVAIDAVLPVISANNPELQTLLKKGVKKELLQRVWMKKDIKNWGELAGTGNKDEVQVYTRSDAAGAPETWAKYLGGKQADLKGVGVFGDPGLAETVAKNKLAIGYNNINYIYDANTKLPQKGLHALPIDLNGNGTLDEDENFYKDLKTVDAAIAKGKLPSPPARTLFLVSNGKPEDEPVRSFLKWVLTDGQKFVEESGYVKLTDDILKKEAEKVSENKK